MSVSLSNYPTLNNFAIVTPAGISVGTLTVANGTYGSTFPLYIGTFIPSGTPSGEETDPITVNTAQNELNSLISDINTYTAGLTSQTLGTVSTAITLYPDIDYNSGGAITFSGAPIILDGQNQTSPQFFITATTSITFESVPSITFIGNASTCNIFWVGGINFQISFTGTSPDEIPGVFIGGGITFESASTVVGRTYTLSALVGFTGVSSIDAACTSAPPTPTPTPSPVVVSDICFLANTPICTDQGVIAIQNMRPTLHTIGGDKVVAITKTISPDNYLICFDKHALGENYPTQKTVMSKDHKIFYGGKMVAAQKFMHKFSGVYPVKYNKQILYNVLMQKHSSMVVNNLMCETLHPDNIVAQIYMSNVAHDAGAVARFNNIVIKRTRDNKNTDKIKRLYPLSW